MKNNVSDWLFPLLLLLLAGAVRAAYLAEYAQTPLGAIAVGADVREYDAWAREIIGGRTWWTQLNIHGPLYPYVLAAGYYLTGMNVLAMRALQLGLDLAAWLCVWGAVRLLWGRWPAFFAGLIGALYLPLIYYSAELVSEGLVVFLMSAVLLVWAGVVQQRAPHVLYTRTLLGLALAGLLLGAAAITHPLSLSFTVLFAGFMVWWCWRKHGLAHALLAATLLVLSIPAAIIPVTLHNYRISGEWVLIQARGGLNFYIGNNDSATGTPNIRPGRAYDRLLVKPAAAGQVRETAAAAFYRHDAFQFIRQQPGRWLRLLWQKGLLTWNAVDITSGSDLPQAQTLTPLMRWPLPRFGWLVPLAFAGACLSWRRREAWPFLLAPIAYTLALTLTVTSGRYRLGMVPALIALAAVGACGLYGIWQRRAWRQDWPALTAAGLGLAVAWLPAVPPVPQNEAEFAKLMAEAHWRQDDYHAATPWLLRGLALAPDDPALHHMIATVLARRGSVAEALTHFDQAIAGNPTDVEPRIAKGVFLSSLGRYADAESELMAAVTREPDAAYGWYNLGVLAEQQGQSDLAQQHYARALDLQPALVSAHLNLGVLRFQQRDFRQAQAHLTRAATLDPRRARPFACLAAVLAETGQFAAATRAFEQALAVEPQQPDLWLAYARMRHQQGDFQAAEMIRRRGLAANPGNRELAKPIP